MNKNLQWCLWPKNSPFPLSSAKHSQGKFFSTIAWRENVFHAMGKLWNWTLLFWRENSKIDKFKHGDDIRAKVFLAFLPGKTCRLKVKFGVKGSMEDSGFDSGDRVANFMVSQASSSFFQLLLWLAKENPLCFDGLSKFLKEKSFKASEIVYRSVLGEVKF